MSEVVDTTAGAVRGAARRRRRCVQGHSRTATTRAATGASPRRDRRCAWADVRDCVEYGPSCPQVTVAQMTGQELPAEIETFMGVWNHERRTGEDCLVLNVWTPRVGDGASRPVLVWLHGGGMAVGSASWPLYDFTNLARNNDVVVVGINHRLGVLGFLDVSHLGDEFADSGNVGMLDIVAALEWVRDNIAQFGGDPSNVTIFGESGGGSKVTCLLGMPSAQGLFRSACAMSGALLEAHTPETARANTDAVLEQLGVGTDVEALRKLDADAIVQASVAISGSGLAAARAGFGPTLVPQPAGASRRRGPRADRGVASTWCSGAPPTRWSPSWERRSSSRPTRRPCARCCAACSATTPTSCSRGIAPRIPATRRRRSSC